MNNINFSNPYLLLIGLLLFCAIFITFFVLIKKEGFNFHNIVALVIHAVIAVLITLTVAGMYFEINITETDVYVLADCSYSSNRNLSTIDDSINRLYKNLPNNSKVAVVCYGKDYKVVTDLGEKFNTVKDSGIDDSQTNVKNALEYVASVFNDNVVKRIVVISDGIETSSKSISGLISDYEQRGIHIDAMFLDNTLTEDANEFQISNVELNDSTFVGKSEEAIVSIESNKDVSTVSIELKLNGVRPSDRNDYKVLTKLNKGTNKFSFELDTTIFGTQSYEVTVSEYKDSEHTESTDTNPYNNTYTFTQTVSQDIKILFLSNDETSGENELKYFKSIYNDTDRYTITSFINDDENIPFLLEDLCKYDEIVLDSFNVSKETFKDNAESFVNNVNTLVSEYGKSLITFGNTSTQNSTGSDSLSTLSNMLPVNYGANNDAKTYTILLDISKSMAQASHLIIAKTAACNLLSTLSTKDYFTVITFYGDNAIIASGRASAENIEAAKKKINDVEAKQATNIEGALEYAYSLLESTTYKTKRVMLISDGKSFTNGTVSNVESLKQMFSDKAANNITTSAILINEDATQGNISTYPTILNALASTGASVTKIVTEEEANGTAFDSIIDKETEVYKKDNNFKVKTAMKNHEVLNGITVSKNVTEFYSSSAKSSANTVMNVIDKGTEYPLYATWNYGDGVVSSYTSLIKDYSTQGTNEAKFINNIGITSTPKKQLSAPFDLEISLEGDLVSVEVTTTTVSSLQDIYLSVIGTDFNETYKLSRGSSNYFTSFEIENTGTYRFTLTCDNSEVSKMYNISYFDEYDSFIASDSSFLYNVITSDGKVSEDMNLVINNDNVNIVKYKYEFAPLFMILSVILFVVEIAIRKIKLQDIKSLFKRKKVK